MLNDNRKLETQVITSAYTISINVKEILYFKDRKNL